MLEPPGDAEAGELTNTQFSTVTGAPLLPLAAPDDQFTPDQRRKLAEAQRFEYAFHATELAGTSPGRSLATYAIEAYHELWLQCKNEEDVTIEQELSIIESCVDLHEQAFDKLSPVSNEMVEMALHACRLHATLSMNAHLTLMSGVGLVWVIEPSVLDLTASAKIAMLCGLTRKWDSSRRIFAPALTDLQLSTATPLDVGRLSNGEISRLLDGRYDRFFQRPVLWQARSLLQARLRDEARVQVSQAIPGVVADIVASYMDGSPKLDTDPSVLKEYATQMRTLLNECAANPLATPDQLRQLAVTAIDATFALWTDDLPAQEELDLFEACLDMHARVFTPGVDSPYDNMDAIAKQVASLRVELGLRPSNNP